MNSETPEPMPEEPDEVSREIEMHLKRLVRWKQRAEFCQLATPSLFLLGFVLKIVLRNFSFEEFYLLPISIIVIVSWVMIYYFRRRYKMALASLQNLNDLSHLGALLDVISFGYRPGSQELNTPLLKMLNQLQASHNNLLSPGQRGTLYAMLSPDHKPLGRPNDKTLLLAILNALEQIGDKDAIPSVAVVEMSNGDAEVREAASECLVFLRQRAEQQSVSGTLLRPSDAENAAPNSLLRAAISRPDDAPEILLRANATPDERHP